MDKYLINNLIKNSNNNISYSKINTYELLDSPKDMFQIKTNKKSSKNVIKENNKIANMSKNSLVASVTNKDLSNSNINFLNSNINSNNNTLNLLNDKEYNNKNKKIMFNIANKSTNKNKITNFNLNNNIKKSITKNCSPNNNKSITKDYFISENNKKGIKSSKVSSKNIIYKNSNNLFDNIKSQIDYGNIEKNINLIEKSKQNDKLTNSKNTGNIENTKNKSRKHTIYLPATNQNVNNLNDIKNKDKLMTLNEKKRKSILNKSKIINDNHKIREDVMYNIVEDINKKTYGKDQYISNTIDLLLAIFMTLNMIFSILDNEIYINETNIFLTERMINENQELITLDILQSMDQRDLSILENILRYSNGLLVFMSLILIIWKHKKIVQMNILFGLMSISDSIFSKRIIKKLIFEFTIAIIYLPPHLNLVFVGSFQGNYWSYSLNSIFSLIVMTKIYFILVLWFKRSTWTSETAAGLCKKYNVPFGEVFAIKCELKKRPFLILSIIMIVVLSICSFTLRTFEFGVKTETDTNFIGNNNLQSLFNCMHFIFFTITTVGYGDMVPRSFLGRGIAIISMIIGTIILALIIASLSVVSEFNNQEKKAYSTLKRLYAVNNTMMKGGKLIKTFLELRVILNKRRNITEKTIENNLMYTMDKAYKINQNIVIKSLSEKLVAYSILKRSVSMFKNNFKLAQSLPLLLDRALNNIQQNLEVNLETMKNKIKLYHKEEEKLLSLIDSNVCLKNKLENINNMQLDIGKYLINLNNTKYHLLYSEINTIKSKKID